MPLQHLPSTSRVWPRAGNWKQVIQTWSLISKSFQTNGKTDYKPVSAVLSREPGYARGKGSMSHNSCWQTTDSSAGQRTAPPRLRYQVGRESAANTTSVSTQRPLVGQGRGTRQGRTEGAGAGTPRRQPWDRADRPCGPWPSTARC